MSSPTHAEPLLRTLAPLLRGLERPLRAWLSAKHVYPRPMVASARLEGLADDLHRQADALDVEQPALVVMLMGGTGVGKSTLLNALAGGDIAQASFARPTTRDPVVYYHESIKPEKFDPLLRTCRLASHDRPALTQKLLVDTPDLDSTDPANREKTKAVLPVADVILLVGSQEKYHDKLIWDEFLMQRRRRAFAFVMNKWDRCMHAFTHGVRPDEDLLRDLQEQGFKNPLLFRTNAQYWVDKAAGVANGELPEGEQFLDLISWLEMGLNRLEIDAIKARGIGQLLEHLEKALEEIAPPDFTELACRTRGAWEKTLGEEAIAAADVLLNTLQPYQGEIEHHFTVESQKRFRGPMAMYLDLFNRMKYFGTTIGDRFSLLPRRASKVETPKSWDLAEFTRSCSAVAGERQLDARNKALANRLLLQANDLGFPQDLLAARTESASRMDWRGSYAQSLIEVLEEVESQWSHPSGMRRWVHNGVLLLGNTLPPVALFTAFGVVLWRFFMVQLDFGLTQFLIPFAATLVVLIFLQALIVLVLPLRWTKIRGEFQGLLEERLRAQLMQGFAAIPTDAADQLRAERRQAEELIDKVREVTSWLEQRQQAASVSGLYGN